MIINPLYLTGSYPAEFNQIQRYIGNKINMSFLFRSMKKHKTEIWAKHKKFSHSIFSKLTPISRQKTFVVNALVAHGYLMKLCLKLDLVYSNMIQ